MGADQPRLSVDRRAVFKVASGATVAAIALTATPRLAQAQTTSDLDALNLVLNMEYLLAQFISAATAEAVPIDRLTGGGVAGVPVRPGRALTFSDPLLRTVVAEMAADNRNHLLPIRTVIGALSARQPLIDISSGPVAPFSVAMQRAGVVSAGAAFDPYSSEEYFLYALLLLKNVSVAAYRGITPTISNRVVVQNFTGLLAAEAIHLASVRSFLYTRGASQQRLRENADKIAAFQNTLNAADVFQALSPATRTVAGVSGSWRMANVVQAQSNGQTAGRSAAQTLNQLYLTAQPTSAGGFFPEGVNGTIRTSASA